MSGYQEITRRDYWVQQIVVGVAGAMLPCGLPPVGPLHDGCCATVSEELVTPCVPACGFSQMSRENVAVERVQLPPVSAL